MAFNVALIERRISIEWHRADSLPHDLVHVHHTEGVTRGHRTALDRIPNGTSSHRARADRLPELSGKITPVQTITEIAARGELSRLAYSSAMGCATYFIFIAIVEVSNSIPRHTLCDMLRTGTSPHLHRAPCLLSTLRASPHRPRMLPLCPHKTPGLMLF